MPPDNMPLLWREEYALGIKEIDDQHQRFVGLLGALYQAIEAGQVKETLDEILSQVINYTAEHFATEEKYFAEFQYPEAREHIAKHNDFKIRIGEMQKQFQDDKLKLSFALVDFMEDWLVDHLSSMDKKYVACFHEHGL